MDATRFQVGERVRSQVTRGDLKAGMVGTVQRSFLSVDNIYDVFFDSKPTPILMRGHEHYVDRALGLNLPSGFDAIAAARQPDIHQDQVRMRCSGVLERRGLILGDSDHLVTGVMQKLGNGFGVRLAHLRQSGSWSFRASSQDAIGFVAEGVTVPIAAVRGSIDACEFAVS